MFKGRKSQRKGQKGLSQLFSRALGLPLGRIQKIHSYCKTNRGKSESKQLATRHNCYSTQAERIMKAGEMGKIAKLGTAGKRNNPTVTPQ
jgi:hypothetical protein